jgi:hypothetical protein
MLDSGLCLLVLRGEVVFLAAPALLVSAVTEGHPHLNEIRVLGKGYAAGGGNISSAISFLVLSVSACTQLLCSPAPECKFLLTRHAGSQ